MSERTAYKHGDPSWVDNSSADPSAMASFYSELFGWETEDLMPREMGGEYHMAMLRGKVVAALASQQGDGPAVWNTYVTVDSVDETAKAAGAAGGTVLAEPFDVMEAGRMAVLADPAGAVFMAWEPRDRIGAELVNETGAFGWNELTTRDVAGSKDFYGSIFGWTNSETDFDGSTYTMWHHPEDEDEGIGGMMPMEGDAWPEDMPPHWMVYFVVDDPDATGARCKELGGEVPVPAFDSPAGRMSVLTDPQGAAFSVIKPAEQQA